MWLLSKQRAKGSDPAEVLRSAIRKRVDRAVAGDPESSGGGIDEVNRLAQLLAAYEQSRPPQPRRIWPVVLMVLGTAGIVSAFLFMHVWSTEISFGLNLSSVLFRVASDASVSDAEQVQLLGRIHPSEVTVDDAAAVELDDVPVPDLGSSNFKLSSADGQGLSIRALEVPTGTWAVIKADDETGWLTIELYHPTVKLAVILSLSRDARPRSSDAALARALESGTAERALFRSSRRADCEHLRLGWLVPRSRSSMTAADGAGALPFRGALPVDVLLFIDLTAGSQHLSTQFSSVLGGSIYLEEVEGREVPIRRDQLLVVDLGTPSRYDPVRASGPPEFCGAAARHEMPAAPARILRIALGDRGIALQGVATVKNLSTGTRSSRQNLMPRWLEWLQTRPELLLFLSAFISLFGFAYKIFSWWQGSR